jgi:hypothetical protein
LNEGATSVNWLTLKPDLAGPRWAPAHQSQPVDHKGIPLHGQTQACAHSAIEQHQPGRSQSASQKAVSRQSLIKTSKFSVQYSLTSVPH